MTFTDLRLLLHFIYLYMQKLLFLFTSILFFSCHEKKTAPAQEQPVVEAQSQSYDTSFKNQVIYPVVHCQQNENTNYTLLLPQSYDALPQCPVIFFIDAHADGMLPIEKYKQLSGKFGYIFIGNNNSKNGNSLEGNAEFINETMQDAFRRFSINRNRIYVCGFSGGSRVAGYIAQNNLSITGVIACGAGMPVDATLAARQFIYIGIAGNEDFNYTEMKRTDDQLKSTAIRHELVTFDGKHEWCPVEVMEEAVTGIEFDAIKKKLAPVNEKLINDFISNSSKQSSLLEKQHRKYDLSHHLHKMINFLDGLRDVSEYRQKVSAIESSAAYKEEAKARNAAEAKEDALKKQYVQLFTEKDEGWWRNEIEAISQRSKSGSSKEEMLIQKRILSYLSLAAFSYSNNAMNQNNFDAAIRYMNLYKIIDPPNSEHSYMLAEVYAEKNETEKSIRCLNDAVKLGFKDAARMENDQHFTGIKNSPAFAEILNGIKNAEK